MVSVAVVAVRVVSVAVVAVTGVSVSVVVVPVAVVAGAGGRRSSGCFRCAAHTARRTFGVAFALVHGFLLLATSSLRAGGVVHESIK